MTKPKKLSYAKLLLKYHAATAALATVERYRHKELVELHTRRDEIARLKGDIIRLQGEINHLSFENAKLSKKRP